MIIVNEPFQDKNAYTISIGEDTYRAYANNESEALDIIADYLENNGHKDLYFDHFTLEVMAECSKHKTADAFAEAHNLTCCGTNRIYLNIREKEEMV